MQIKKLDTQVSVAEQITPEQLPELAAEGFGVLVCNRPDDEAQGQPAFADIEAEARAHGMEAVHIPFRGADISDAQRAEFIELLNADKKILAFCRTGNRSSLLWAAARQALGGAPDEILAQAKAVGMDVSAALKDSNASAAPPQHLKKQSLQKTYYEVLIVGAGTGGISVAASLLQRKADLRIALVDAATEHFYQPGWTMVGGGVFTAASTQRTTAELIPRAASWIQQQVASFSPDENKVCLNDGRDIHYGQLVISPGLKIDWSAIEGLSESLGKNGVTSNYRYDLAPYTWELVQGLKQGKAVFTQPPMPIKCAGAPQKALYLSADHWFKQDLLNAIDIQFYNAGAVLFGVADYVPALQAYMEKYGADLNFGHTLVKVDGDKQRAWFKTQNAAGDEQMVETDFDMLHVCPPQRAPDFIRDSVLADAAGWLDVNQQTLQHKKVANIWGLGDVTNTPNAKTMAAVRRQVPVVAQNICDVLRGKPLTAAYDGYGSCPLTVERGKVVLAEFGYGGKVLPTFPAWVNDGTQATKRAWFLKAKMLPAIYWQGMLKGREWLAAPLPLDT